MSLNYEDEAVPALSGLERRHRRTIEPWIPPKKAPISALEHAREFRKAVYLIALRNESSELDEAINESK